MDPGSIASNALPGKAIRRSSISSPLMASDRHDVSARGNLLDSTLGKRISVQYLAG